MKVRYTYRCYPTPRQERSLARVFGACRYVYNKALHIRTDAWQTEQRKVTYFDTSAMTAVWKRTDESWLQSVSSVPVQQSLRHLQTAFINFWNKTTMYPAFKRKHAKQSAEYTVSAFKYNSDTRQLKISGIGVIDVRWSRGFKSKPTTVTITKRPSGKYFVTLCLDEVVKPVAKTGKAVGIDLGVSRLATLSTGERVANPKYLAKNLAKLQQEQRRLSRKTKGSNRYANQKKRVARVHEYVANCRKDYLAKLTTRLVKEFDVIKIEDLNVRGMIANHCLARAVSDVGIYAFRQMLTYKAVWYGKDLQLVDRFFPSSKRCHCCGYVSQKLPLAVREWVCPECQAPHDRDENAAINILFAEGHSVKARGVTVRRLRSSGPKCKSLRNANLPCAATALA